MARDDYGAISVISDEEREALGLGGGSKRPDEEEEGLFETLGKAGDKLGETKLGQKIGSILTVIILAFFGGGGDLSAIQEIFGGEEEPIAKGGCMDISAINYKSDATFDNGSCAFPPPVKYGCMDVNAINYDSQATHDNNRCNYPPNQNGTGEGNETQTNETVYGCMDIDANNFNDRATEDDGSCDYENEVNHCNHTQLIVWGGLDEQTIGYFNEGNHSTSMNVSYQRDSVDNLDIWIDMDTNCNDPEEPLNVKVFYDIGHVFPSFDDNGTFEYYMYDNYTYDEFDFEVYGWEGDEHWLYANVTENTFTNEYEGVYFFYVNIQVDWNNTGEYEYVGYFTNWPSWNGEYNEEDGLRLEEVV